jgi:hypothetical protein
VGFLGIFYTFMAWIVFTAYGKSHIVDAATHDPVGLVFTAIDHYVGHPAMVVTEVLLVTSAFASALAFHNTAIRYLHALGRERLLPGHRQGAPVPLAVQRQHRQTVFTLLVPGHSSSQAQRTPTRRVPARRLRRRAGHHRPQTACSASILMYFNVRHKDHGLSRWSTLVARC